MNNMKIKAKLILLFVVIKVIPLLVLSYVAIIGVKNLSDYFSSSTQSLFTESKAIISNTADIAIIDSIKALDKKSQTSMEVLSYNVANNIASFLYERDNDILLLSHLQITQENLKAFYDSKLKDIVVHDKYFYNDKDSNWQKNSVETKVKRDKDIEILHDNKREFNYIDPINLNKKSIPIYKEIVYFDINGQEQYKVSTLNKNKLDISLKKNTYIKAETYFDEIKMLKKDEIYVSEVIGEYVGSKIIGSFTKEKAKKSKIDFNPELYGYAGKENPVGKRFEGIIRFITPVYKDGIRMGYLSFALDHRHIMEFTDTLNPTKNFKQDIADASSGNYAFMWDFEGKNISHPRDYFIVGYDSSTGNMVPGWMSDDLQKKFENSKEKDLNQFLKAHPKFEEQSLSKKPNFKQLKQKGEISLDCRYLNFAPQCQGWMQVTQNGGYGSFIIYWSKVWKLTTAATIPYYTGKYKNSKRGFGFVTIGANVDEFHSAANETKDSINEILNNQTAQMKKTIEKNRTKVGEYIQIITNELSFATVIMILIVIIIAVWMSKYITNKIENLLIGTEKFAKHDLDYKIKVTSNDEIGLLEKSFNNMSYEVKKLLEDQKELNEHLEEKVEEKTILLKELNTNLEQRVQEELKINRLKDAQLLEQSKMATMGEMITMIIHQWKQPLNAINIVNSGMKLKVMLDKLTIEDINRDNEIIEKQIHLMSTTMDDFKNFFKQTKKIEYVVKDNIEATIGLVGNIYALKNVNIIFKSNSSAKTIGYPNELTQVLINILNNARDIILENNLKKQNIYIVVEEDSSYVYISIQDCAGGVSDDIIDDIFNPYFTTKNEDEGTGLGLYMSKNILDKIGAKISVTNEKVSIEKEEFLGAKFTISLVKVIDSK